MRYTVYETNALDPEEVSRLKRDMSEVSFSREYLCDFDAAGVNQLISLALIEESVRRIYKPGQFDYQAKIIGIDPARYGDDLSTIVKRQGLCCFEPISFAGLDNMALADQVVYHIETWKPDAVFCDAGNGAGVIDRIRQLGHSVIEVPFGGASTNPKYANKRAQMWGDMAQWLKDGGQLPDHPRLKADLAGPTYWFDQKGRMMLEPKSEMKARGLPSPDFGDALCTTFAATVMPKKHEVPRWSGNSLHASEYVYDPRRF